MADNMQVLGGGFYIAKTQAGFCKVLKSILRRHNEGQHPDYQLEFSQCNVLNWPTSYPSLVTVSFRYSEEYGWCYGVHQINLGKLKDALHGM